MTDKEIMDEVRDFACTLIRKQPSRERKSEAASALLAVGYELTRGIEGNDFISGWLQMAVDDLQTNPPSVTVRVLQ